jgi:integrase
MTKKKFRPDCVESETGKTSSINVIDQYQDHIDSFYDSLLVKEKIRRKELGLPFSKQDAEEFLKEIQQALSKKDKPCDDGLSTQASKKFKNPLIEKAEQEGKQATLKQMQSTSVEDSIRDLLKTLSSNTRKVYERGLKDLAEAGLIRLHEKQSSVKTSSRSLYDFAYVPHDLILEKIFSHPSWSSSIKTRNATAYKNFIKYLGTRTEGIITFLTTKSMFPKQRIMEPKTLLSSDQINRVLALLKEENPRDYCVVYLYLFSYLKLNETLKLRKKDLNHKKSQDICSLLPYFQDLSDNDYLFCTRNREPLDPMQISRTLQRIYDKTNIPSVPLRDLKKILSSRNSQ